MRVLFGAVVCVLAHSQIFVATAQETSIQPSTETSTETTGSSSCTSLDPPENEAIAPEKTSANLIWSTRQTDQHCISSTLTVNCEALWQENLDGWLWVRNRTGESAVDSKNDTTEVRLDHLTEYTNYTCYAMLLGEELNSSFSKKITFQTKAEVSSPPLNLNPTEIGSRNFTIQWEKPEKIPGIFVKYIVHVQNYGPNHFLPSDCPSQTDDSWAETTTEEYNFLFAAPDYEYRITVLAQNTAGNGSEASINITTTTTASEIPRQFELRDPVLNTDANEISVNISWYMPCNTNGPIEHFYAELDGFYTLDNNIQDSRNFTVEAGSVEYYSKKIGGLMPASNYSLRIQAIGSEEGDVKNYTFSTEDNLPGAPILGNISEIGPTFFTISWEEPERRAGAIERYEIRIASLGPLYQIEATRCPADNSVFNDNVTFDEMTYDFKMGLPYYLYNVSVAAVTSKGTGEWGTIVAKTVSSEPQKPEDLQFQLVDGNTTVNVSWRTPCHINGPIDGFLIMVTGNYTEDDFPLTYNHTTLVSYQNSTYAYSHKMDLSESYNYKLTVGVILQNGAHGLTAGINFTTPDGSPGPPNITQIRNVSDTSFAILWARPSLRNGRIVQYQVNVTSMGPSYETHCALNATQNYSYTTNGSTTLLNFSEGEPYYNYNISIRASTSAGAGNISDIDSVTTAQSFPENVEIIQTDVTLPTQQIYDGKASISFEPPCRINGASVQYKLSLTGTRENFATVNTTIDIGGTPLDVALKPQYDYKYVISTANEKYSNSTASRTFSSYAGVPQFNESIKELNVKAAVYTATFVLRKRDFDTNNGEIKYVAIILSENNNLDGKFERWDMKRNETWPSVKEENSYEVTEERWNPFNDEDVVTFTIGNGSSCSGHEHYCNKPLEGDRDYYVIIRIFTTDFFKNSHAIFFRTEAASKLGVILGVIFGLLTVALFGIAGFFLWRNNNMKLPPILYARKVSANKIPTDGNTSIPIHKFLLYCKSLENNPEKFTEQYSSLTEKSKELMTIHTTSFAELTENRRKNRYTNILPYDATRVKLLIDEDDEIGSDYINASYIKGYSGSPEYIATQGPLPTTCRDFWKMVIQEKVSIIVMVTQFVEDNKEKCYKYFPNNHESMAIGDDMEVKCTMELHFGTYCVRTIQVKKDSTQITVTHMQYLDWPDFNVPKGTDTMLQFCHQLRERLKIEGGCVIVHCSAGVGRTGTLIATDILIQSINAGKNIDIFNTVLELRKQRMLMVQAQKQYVYIHNLIRDTLEQSRSLGLNDNLEPLYENQSALQLKTDDDSLIDKEKEKESQF